MSTTMYVLSRNKKNIDAFWWKKAPYQELCMISDKGVNICDVLSAFLYTTFLLSLL